MKSKPPVLSAEELREAAEKTNIAADGEAYTAATLAAALLKASKKAADLEAKRIDDLELYRDQAKQLRKSHELADLALQALGLLIPGGGNRCFCTACLRSLVVTLHNRKAAGQRPDFWARATEGVVIHPDQPNPKESP
jgi:hypothetical protein